MFNLRPLTRHIDITLTHANFAFAAKGERVNGWTYCRNSEMLYNMHYYAHKKRGAYSSLYSALVMDERLMLSYLNDTV